jgi:hypothetical protein
MDQLSQLCAPIVKDLGTLKKDVGISMADHQERMTDHPEKMYLGRRDVTSVILQNI